MKATRKLISLLLACVLVLALSATALAVDTGAGGPGTITIENPVKDATYSIYKLFDATVSTDGTKIAYTLPAGKTLGSPANGWFDVTNGYVTAKASFTDDVLTSDAFKTWAQSFGTKVGSDVKASSDNNLVFENVPYGYYYVKSSVGAVLSVDSTMPTATVIEKNDAPTINDAAKVVITADGREVKLSEAALGQKLHFKISFVTKNYYKGEMIRSYLFVDRLPAGMSFASWPVVTVGTLSNTGETDTINAGSVNTTGGNVGMWFVDSTGKYISDLNANWKLKLRGGTLSDAEAALASGMFFGANWVKGTQDAFTPKYDNGTVVTIEYDAYLNPALADKVNYGDTPNSNTAYFYPVFGPDNPPVDVIPNPEYGTITSDVYSTQLTVKKTDGDGNILKGAEFTLTGPTGTITYTSGVVYTPANNGNYYKLKDGGFTSDAPTATTSGLYESTTQKYIKESVDKVQGANQTATEIKGFVNDNGELVFKGLSAGTYTLHESVVPTGYNTAADVEFTVSFDRTYKTFSTNLPSDKITVTNNKLAITIVNNAGTELPGTGGVGTTIFYVLGACLLLGAAVLLITRKRMSNQI